MIIHLIKPNIFLIIFSSCNVFSTNDKHWQSTMISMEAGALLQSAHSCDS